MKCHTDRSKAESYIYKTGRDGTGIGHSTTPVMQLAMLDRFQGEKYRVGMRYQGDRERDRERQRVSGVREKVTLNSELFHEIARKYRKRKFSNEKNNEEGRGG